jgi:hypothetical protein
MTPARRPAVLIDASVVTAALIDDGPAGEWEA